MVHVCAASANANPILLARHVNVQVFKPIVLRPTTKNRNQIKFVPDMAIAIVISASAIRGALEIFAKALQGMRL
jgi:hypothetical protein